MQIEMKRFNLRKQMGKNSPFYQRWNYQTSSNVYTESGQLISSVTTEGRILLLSF